MRFSKLLVATQTLALRVLSRINSVWTAAQVSRCGSYSIARLQAFDTYCRVTSLTRVVAVCVLTPLPSLMFPLLLECIPLNPAKLGWDANWNLWVRCALSTTVLTMSFITQARQVLPDLVIPRWHVFSVALCTGVSFTGVSMLIAWQWRFPIPFAFVVTSMPFGCLALFFFVVLVGTQPFQQVRRLGVKLRQLWRMMMVQFTLITIYPIYSALFMWFSSEQQTLFLITLPVLKLMMKNLMARTFIGTDLEDSIPEITVFSVEIFNSLYISACLQMANSAQRTMFIIIGIDVAQSIFMGHGVLKRAIVPPELRDEPHSSGIIYASVRESCRQLQFLRGGLNTDQDLKSLMRKGPRASPATQTGCNEIDRFMQVFGGKGVNSVVPSRWLTTGQQSPLRISSRSRDERTRIIKQTLAMLFNCEYLVLVEYIECVIPIVYSVFTSVLFHLHNAAFYPHIRTLTSEKLRIMMSHLIEYTLLEVVTLLGLCLLLRLKLKVSALYQLAFVLETHMEMVQAKLFVWVVYSLTYGLDHAGEHNVCDTVYPIVAMG